MPTHRDTIVDLLTAAAARRPAHPAVEDLPKGAITYRDLDALSDRVRDRLRHMGVNVGDRVGVYLGKSIDAYAAMLGAMKAGAAYVPIDPSAPAWRSAFITSDCSVAALVIDRANVPAWQAEASRHGIVPPILPLDAVGGGAGLGAALDQADAANAAPPTRSADLTADDLAYILYTSGSTGTPKGVMLTHRCAVAFVDWCSEAFAFTPEDRFSSHAPFHFDLSIFDLYVPLRHAATVVLIPADQGKEPVGLAELIAERRLTVWYSTPTILSVLAEFGRMPRHDYSALRSVFFAGEVFALKHLRATKALLPHAKFFNLYGPTETNVCTWHPIPDRVEDDRTEPYPIGTACGHFRARVVDESGRDVPSGTEGELVVCGDGVMRGYWNLPDRTIAAFRVDEDGRRWYRTGDIVVADGNGVLAFRGRRDRMVKRRGYRIELGEIEAGFYRHPNVQEAAAVAITDGDGGVRIKVYIALGAGHARSEIEMRRFCAGTLPAYMIPDSFAFLDGLPKTSTDKIDYQRLTHVV